MDTGRLTAGTVIEVAAYADSMHPGRGCRLTLTADAAPAAGNKHRDIPRCWVRGRLADGTPLTGLVRADMVTAVSAPGKPGSLRPGVM